MSVKIRLSRGGAKKRPYYYVVVAHTTSPRDGRYIEQIGTFNPMLKKDDETRVKLELERCKYWLSVGAQPTDRVARLLDAAGLMKRTASNNPEKVEAEEEAPGARSCPGREGEEGRRGSCRCRGCSRRAGRVSLQSARAANRSFNPAVSKISRRGRMVAPRRGEIDARKRDIWPALCGFARRRSRGRSGLAVLREGKVLGSDPLGAVFTGTYQFDPARQLNKVRLRLDVPADGVPVTGFAAGPSGATLDIVSAFAGTLAETTSFIQIAGAPVGVQIRYLGPLPN